MKYSIIMLEIRYAENELWLNEITQNEKGNINPTVDNMVLILNNDEKICTTIPFVCTHFFL